MTPELTIHRYVAVYEQQDEQHVTSIDLALAEFAFLRTLLGYSDQDEMYDCYRFEMTQLPALVKLLGDRLPIGKFDYFLEADASA